MESDMVRSLVLDPEARRKKVLDPLNQERLLPKRTRNIDFSKYTSRIDTVIKEEDEQKPEIKPESPKY